MSKLDRKACALKPRLADLLVCPIDGGPLELVEWETAPFPLADPELVRVRRMGLRPEKFNREVLTGLLRNPRRRVYYPIVGGVPRLLAFPTAVGREFARQNRLRLERDAPGYAVPAQAGAPGEKAALRRFPNEWVHYEWDERAYWGQSAKDLLQSMRFALDLDHKKLTDRLVLDVGIGIGGIGDYVERVTECELVGIELSHAVDEASRHFSANPFLHVVQASPFAPPFAEGQFEYVYSQGLLHHTYSTRNAFNSISRLPRPGGRFYVWVFSQFDERRTRLRRALYRAEAILRPVYSRLPGPAQSLALAPWAPLYIAHQRLAGRHNPHVARYSWRDAMHAAHDRWALRYAQRHTEDQVRGWFTAAGYGDLRSIGDGPRPDYVPEALVACIGIEGTRLAR